MSYSSSEWNDHHALVKLITDYANAIDRRAWSELDQVFTPDARIDYSEMGGAVGSYGEIKAWLPKALGFFSSYMHFVGNPRFEISGDKATGQIACFNPMLVPGLFGKRTVFLGLWYHDTYVRTAAGWRIASRREEQSYMHNMPIWMRIGVWLAVRKARKQAGAKA
jgi:hypothetical protein